MPRAYRPEFVPPISLRDLDVQAIASVCATWPDLEALEPKAPEQFRFGCQGTIVVGYVSSAMVQGTSRPHMEEIAAAIRTRVGQLENTRRDL
jgi:hypothetical protein